MYLLRMRAYRYCSYVGTRGVAWFTANKDGSLSGVGETLIFTEKMRLWTVWVNKYVNGRYQYTRYLYRWGGEGEREFVKKGKFRSQSGQPSSADPFWFCLAAEASWVTFVLPSARAELDRTGKCSFTLGDGRSLAIGEGFLEFVVQGRTTRWTKAEIAGVDSANGTYTIRPKEGVSALTTAGKRTAFALQHASVPNGRLFLLLLDELVGFRFT